MRMEFSSETPARSGVKTFEPLYVAVVDSNDWHTYDHSQLEDDPQRSIV